MIIDHTVASILSLPRVAKRMIALTVDAALCVLTVWLAFYLRLSEWVPLSGDSWPAAVTSLAIALPIFVVSGLYRAVFRYISWEAIATIAQAVLVYGLIYSAIFTAFGITGVPRTIGILQPILLFIAVSASRAFGRYWLGGGYRQSLRRSNRKNVLIYGTGSTGRQLASALSDSTQHKVVGFIDSDRGLHGSTLGRIRVWNPEKLAAVVAQLDVSEIFLAIPSASRQRRNEILDQVRSIGVAVSTLPGLLDIARGQVTVSDLRPLDIEDLLARPAVAPDLTLLERNLSGKVVLVTGAGGSIGSELCRQILNMGPARLLLVEASEYALYTIHQELSGLVDASIGARVEIVPLLASVCDEARMRRIFATWRPETIYHAAAYKHVPLVEHNPIEGIRNNVLGTSICANLAQEYGAASFVLISTDKAVRPTNIMGASKRLAEMILQAIAEVAPVTCFSMVRFGNVLGSSGSVVPIFRRQIQAGGPVTVTHPEITRYFMTIPEAAQLVLQAGAMAKGGEVFVLDMGEPVKVFDLARRMIELSGLKVRTDLEPDGDIEITFTGLRPGEKLYEELLIGNDPQVTAHPRVLMASEQFIPLKRLAMKLRKLKVALENHAVEPARACMIDLIPEYQPADVVDWVYLMEGEDDPASIIPDIRPPAMGSESRLTGNEAA